MRMRQNDLQQNMADFAHKAIRARYAEEERLIVALGSVASIGSVQGHHDSSFLLDEDGAALAAVWWENNSNPPALTLRSVVYSRPIADFYRHAGNPLAADWQRNGGSS